MFEFIQSISITPDLMVWTGLLLFVGGVALGMLDCMSDADFHTSPVSWWAIGSIQSSNWFAIIGAVAILEMAMIFVLVNPGTLAFAWLGWAMTIGTVILYAFWAYHIANRAREVIVVTFILLIAGLILTAMINTLLALGASTTPVIGWIAQYSYWAIPIAFGPVAYKAIVGLSSERDEP